MFEVLCGTIFKTKYYFEMCQSVLTELAEQKFIHLPRGTSMAKRYVVYRLYKYNVLAKRRDRYNPQKTYWVLNQTWYNMLMGELGSLANAWKKPAKLTITKKKDKWGGKWNVSEVKKWEQALLEEDTEEELEEEEYA